MGLRQKDTVVLSSHLRGQFKAILHSGQRQTDRNLATGTPSCEQALKLLIVVTIKGHAGTQATWHLVGINSVAHHPVGTKAFQLMVVVIEAESVAIGETRQTSDIQRVRTNLLHRSHHLANGLGRIKRSNVRLTSMDEIGGVTTVEGTTEVGREPVLAMPQGGATIFLRMLTDKGIKALTIGCRHILHISHIF